MKKSFSLFALLFVLAPMFSHAAPYPRKEEVFSCSIQGVWERFDLVAPANVNGKFLPRILDLGGMEPMELLLTPSGKITATSFKVEAHRPSPRLGETNRGQLTGVQQTDRVWKMEWRPFGRAANGSTRLIYTCEKYY